jgi:hypothetical protein
MAAMANKPSSQTIDEHGFVDCQSAIQRLSAPLPRILAPHFLML